MQGRGGKGVETAFKDRILVRRGSHSTLSTNWEACARLSSARHVQGFRRLAEICHAEGCAALVQLALSECVLARNGGAMRGMDPGELGKADLQAVEDLFAAGAQRACEAGLDGVQIHAAHGFFLSRFISPAWNMRTDAFGGSPENSSPASSVPSGGRLPPCTSP